MDAQSGRAWTITPRDIGYWSAGIFLIALVLDGVVRYSLSGTGLYLLVYLPKAGLVLSMAVVIFARSALNRVGFAVVGLGALAMTWGLFNLGSPLQAVFGVWVLVPLLFGVVMGPLWLDDPERYGNLAIALLLVASVGILANPYFRYPWIGSNAKLLGESIPAARAWTTYWLERYPGFSHSSINVASQLLIFAILATWARRSRVITLFLWAVSGAGIYLATSKGVQGAYLLVSVYFATIYVARQARPVRIAWTGIAWLLAFIEIAVPLSTVWIRYSLRFHSVWSDFLYGSYGVRLGDTWPTAFASLSKPWSWLIGNGIGAIGSAHRYFGKTKPLMSDNFFVFLAINIGPVLAGFLILWVVWRVAMRYVRKDILAQRVFPLLLAALAYGEVSDIVEGTAVFALVFGIVVCYAFSRPGPTSAIAHA